MLSWQCRYKSMNTTIIIPTYDEEKTIAKLLDRLVGVDVYESIIVDGHSSDRTEEIARKYPVVLIKAPRNRARQLNEGVKAARGDIFLFLHADCTVDSKAINAISRAVAKGFAGGCLSQRIDSKAWIYRIIELSGSLRARIFRIFYGDQAIFATRDVFDRIGGFDEVELFEDVMFSKKMKKVGKTCILNQHVNSSARRWQKQGICRATVINWLVSVGFLLGVSPHFLKKIYYDIR